MFPKESEQFVARYIERAPLALEKLSIQDDIVTYTTKEGAAHEFYALEFLKVLLSTYSENLRISHQVLWGEVFTAHHHQPTDSGSRAHASHQAALLKAASILHRTRRMRAPNRQEQ